MQTVGSKLRLRRVRRHSRHSRILAGVVVSVVAVVALTAWSFRGNDSADRTSAAVVGFAPGDIPGIRTTVTTVTTETIGHSLQGAPINAFFLGDGPAIIAVIGGLHTGNELISVEVVEALLAAFQAKGLPEEVTLVFLPLVNPDGLALDLRVNARGVDLNRNWPSRDWSEYAVHSGEEVFAGTASLSEPETAALFWFLNRLQPSMTLSYHGFAGVVDDNGAGAAAEFAQMYAEATGYEHIEEWVDYHITGQMIDSLGEIGLPAADVELLEGDPLSFSRNMAALEAVINAIAGL